MSNSHSPQDHALATPVVDMATSGMHAEARPKRVTIETACDGCRSRKVRCDGVRPVCGRCVLRRTTCRYDVDAGQTRVGTMKQRHATLAREHQNLLKTLRNASMEDVNELISKLRSKGTSQDQDSNRAGSPSESEAGGIEKPHGSISSASSRHDDSMQSEHSPAGPPSSDATRTLLTPNHSERSNESFHTAEVHSPMTGVPISGGALQLGFPGKDVATVASRRYIQSVGSFMHVYTTAQIELLLDAVFNPKEVLSTAASHAALGQLCAIAALGSIYESEIGARDAQNFYDLARHYLEDVIDTNPLLGMKTAALLATCCMTTKTTVSMSFVDLGFSLAHSSGLASPTGPPEISLDQWLDYKRAWRTLLLLDSWIRSTLGALSWRVHTFASTQAAFVESQSTSDIIQTEMAKIVLLKANMLRTIADSKDLTPELLSVVRNNLKAWHEEIPEVMHLATLLNTAPGSKHRHHIFYVHLLYLGGLMLLQRCIMSKMLGHQADQTAFMQNVCSEAVTGIIDGYEAARQTARILSLLRAEGGAARRCWICVFQSYVSGLLLLHESYSTILQATATRAKLGENLRLIGKTIDMLKFSAVEDSTASILLQSLIRYYDTLLVVAGQGTTPHTTGRTTSTASSPDNTERKVPKLDQKVFRQTAEDLLNLVRQPFTDVYGANSCGALPAFTLRPPNIEIRNLGAQTASGSPDVNMSDAGASTAVTLIPPPQSIASEGVRSSERHRDDDARYTVGEHDNIQAGSGSRQEQQQQFRFK